MSYLQVPKTSKQHFNGENNSIKFGGCHMQGWRNTMEDAAIHKLDIDPGVSLFAVFDGHGSNEVADFCKDHFTVVLRKQKGYQNQDYRDALYNACIEIDKLIKSPYGIQQLPNYQTSNSKSVTIRGTNDGEDIAMISGCAACIVLVADNTIFCANIGDSRCVLGVYEYGEQIIAKNLSYDQKPKLEEEKERIENAGGFVKNNRVDGNINLSRALGDHEFKDDPSLPIDRQKIIPIPEITQTKISQRTPFLILACDGIWDCLTSQEAVQLFQKHLTSGISIERYSELVAEVFDEIIAKSLMDPVGHDNMTCMILQFKS